MCTKSDRTYVVIITNDDGVSLYKSRSKLSVKSSLIFRLFFLN